MSTIQWTDETWNPVVGCSKISEGCLHCYAAEAAKSARLQQFNQYKKVGGWNGITEFVESQLTKPLHWRSPKKIFAGSMTDLFHENTPFSWVDRIFEVIAKCPQHTFQILTKRPERMAQYFEKGFVKYTKNLVEFDDSLGEQREFAYFPLSNVWLGTTVENQAMADKRIPILEKIPAAVRFLSCEPLLEQIHFDVLTGIDWVITGGESGNKSRPCDVDWIRSIVTQCDEQNVPVFVKQLGSYAWQDSERLKLKSRKGGEIDEFPEDLKVREFPNE